MAIERLDHFTIRAADMERTRAFYCDVLGLAAGPRPKVAVPGYWLYGGGVPLVHLVRSDTPPGPANGAFDHVAFRCSDPDGLIARLKAHEIPYRENALPDIGLRQIVIHDPDGIMVELNCGE